MGVAQSQQQRAHSADGRSKQQELADFLSRSEASGYTFSDSKSDASSPRGDGAAHMMGAEAPGGALVMLPSALDPRGRTIRRIVTDPVDEQERLVLVKRRALAAKSFAVATHKMGPARVSSRERTQVTVDDFEYLKVIGVGAMGRVLLVRCIRDGQLYAMKVISKQSVRTNRLASNVVSERDVLGGTDHPSLARLHCAFQTASSLFLVMDYCPGGELSVHLKRASRFPEKLVHFYGAELLLAIEHLHRHGIIYRDLKPENVMLTEDGHLKLVDFGISKFGVTDPTSGATTMCGSYEYVAPEILKQREYGTAVDWWSFGAVLYELLTGLPPWYHDNPSIMAERVLSGPLQLPKYLSIEAKGLLGTLLHRDPMKRLGTRHGSMEIRTHPFFVSIDWDLATFREVHPPIQPCQSSCAVESASNFSSEFTRLPIGSIDPLSSPRSDGSEFAGFDFEAPSSAYVEYDYARDVRARAG